MWISFSVAAMEFILYIILVIVLIGLGMESFDEKHSKKHLMTFRFLFISLLGFSVFAIPGAVYFHERLVEFFTKIYF